MTNYEHGFIAAATAPSAPEAGDIWVDQTAKQIKQWSGAAWNIYTPKPPEVTELTTDFTTSSTSYVDVFTASFTPSGTGAVVRFEGLASASAVGTLSFFQVTIGATSKPIGAVNEQAASAQFAFGRAVKFTGLTPGTAVTIKAQVKTQSGTFNCRPALYPTYEGASLVVHDAP